MGHGSVAPPGPKLISPTEMPPLIRVTHKPSRFHGVLQQAAALVKPLLRGSGFGLRKVIGMANRAHRINLTPHIQRLALGS